MFVFLGMNIQCCSKESIPPWSILIASKVPWLQGAVVICLPAVWTEWSQVWRFSWNHKLFLWDSWLYHWASTYSFFRELCLTVHQEKFCLPISPISETGRGVFSVSMWRHKYTCTPARQIFQGWVKSPWSVKVRTFFLSSFFFFCKIFYRQKEVFFLSFPSTWATLLCFFRIWEGS